MPFFSRSLHALLFLPSLYMCVCICKCVVLLSVCEKEVPLFSLYECVCLLPVISFGLIV